jgi:DNA replicative helicase MCM subunit Mcm2 (Cdc46/Mcm family)|tara:strand:+ start:242 stop:508 length:267 start_codon:yes stop_codon:yes gene_type:complete
MDDFDRLMEIQKLTADRIKRESEVDNKIKILDILNELVISKGKKMQVEELIIEASIRGLSEAEVMDSLNSLKRDGLVKELDMGFVQLV